MGFEDYDDEFEDLEEWEDDSLLMKYPSFVTNQEEEERLRQFFQRVQGDPDRFLGSIHGESGRYLVEIMFERMPLLEYLIVQGKQALTPDLLRALEHWDNFDETVLAWETAGLATARKVQEINDFADKHARKNPRVAEIQEALMEGLVANQEAFKNKPIGTILYGSCFMGDMSDPQKSKRPDIDMYFVGSEDKDFDNTFFRRLEGDATEAEFCTGADLESQFDLNDCEASLLVLRPSREAPLLERIQQYYDKRYPLVIHDCGCLLVGQWIDLPGADPVIKEQYESAQKDLLALMERDIMVRFGVWTHIIASLHYRRGRKLADRQNPVSEAALQRLLAA